MPKQTKLGDNAEIYQPRKQQTEREKLRDLPFKKRINYLWEYYKIHAFVFIAGIALTSYIIYIVVTPKIETQFYAALIDNIIEEQVLDDIQKDFTEHLRLNPEKEDILFNSSFYFSDPSGVSMNSRQILSTFIATGEVDVIIAPESEFASFAYYGFMDKLSEQLPTDLYSSLTNRFYITDLEADPEKSVYGIYLNDTVLFKNYINESNPYILGFIVNSKHKTNSVEFLRYLFQ